ncbi:hypothetical protein [Kordia jejudonensis]|uniref:hypothetical protein n=1 Tax=Kordia jejudonensis TaxID=1348245 RepID=UPI0006290E2F|nr:hypothetical protein [Kordia jejudonensis]
MTQEIDNTADNTLDDVDRIFAISGLAISGLGLLFYAAEEVADSTETDLGFVGTITKTVSMLGLVGTFWSMGLLYHKKIEMPAAIKWVMVPIIVLHVLVLALILSMLALKTSSVGTVGKLAMKYVKPAVCSLGAVGIIIAMAVMPKKLLKMSNIGMAIHYLPAGLGYAPINKNVFYALVILVRAGGLITTLAGDFIELAMDNGKDDSNLDTPEQKQLGS